MSQRMMMSTYPRIFVVAAFAFVLIGVKSGNATQAPHSTDAVGVVDAHPYFSEADLQRRSLLATSVDEDKGESDDDDYPCQNAVRRPFQDRRIIMTPYQIKKDKILNSFIIFRAKNKVYDDCTLYSYKIVSACVERNTSATDKNDYEYGAFAKYNCKNKPYKRIAYLVTLAD